MIERVNHPAHYGGDVIYEVIKVLEATLTPEEFVGFLRGNAIKYTMRAGKKSVDPSDPSNTTLKTSEDLAKAAWYINYELDFYERWTIGDVGEVRANRLGHKACIAKKSSQED